ncbi:MAG: chemotaxis protein CheB [Thiolinea sp.]
MTANPLPENERIIVGIGASAGGLEALRLIVPDLPAHENVVYVLAQHLDPKHSSMLASILANETELPVMEVRDGQELEAAIFYVIPPGVDAYYKDGHLHLEKATGIGPKPSIDRFFHSLSKNHGERSIGIILSGTGSDGAHGIRAIKAEGGIAIAQDETTAKFNNMPFAAISTGHVDLILAPGNIPQQIREFIEHPQDHRLRLQAADEQKSDEITTILQLLLRQTGSDFRDYKRTTLIRRIERRMTVHKFNRLQDYIHYLEERPEELYELHDDILISVTSFFRDRAAFDTLRRHLGNIIRQNDPSPKEVSDLRIWVAGCATGEEAYSIAILIAEYLGQRLQQYKVQIFGTDLYDSVLSIARQGFTPAPP